MNPTDTRRAWRQIAISFAAVCALVFVCVSPVGRRFRLQEAVQIVFLVGAIRSVRWDDDDTKRYGVNLEGIFPGRDGDARSLPRTVIESVPSALREMAVGAGAALLILPIYTAFWPLFNRPIGPRHFAFDQAHWTEIATQFLVVAFTEEIYFRGYVFTRLCDALGVKRDEGSSKVPLRASVVAILLTSVMFMFVHVLVERSIPRLVVFFPSLVFTALRAWRGGIGAAITLHAVCNLWESYLEGR